MSAWRDKEDFKAGVLQWADKLDVRVRSLTLRPMRNKWTSCSAARNLTFNSELIGLDKRIGNYVIVHELLHFYVPNHGWLWKSLMRAHLGEYEIYEEELKRSARNRVLRPPR